MDIITEILNTNPWIGIPIVVIYCLFQIWKQYKAEKRKEKAIEYFIKHENITLIKTDMFLLKRKG